MTDPERVSRPGSKNPLTRLMTEAFDQLMRQCMFCLPGRVVLFDPATQTAQVECGIQRLDRQGQGHTIPVIEGVPVCFAGDGNWYFFHQVTEGTEGLIHFSQRAVDTWFYQGGPVAPHEARMLSVEDAFFVPGVRSRPNAITSFPNDGAGMSSYDGSSRVHLKESGDAEITVPGELAVNCGTAAVVAQGAATVDCDTAQVTAPNGVTVDTPQADFTGIITCAGIQFTGTLPSGAHMETGAGTLELVSTTVNITSGDVVADGISLKTHTHPGDSGGTTGQPQ